MGRERETGRLECVVADDHEAIRRGLTATFAATGDLRIVAEAASVAELVELATRRRPDVLVVDLGLPGAGGLDACRQLVARGVESAVVVYTGLDDLDLLEQALELGVQGFVLKGSPTEDLLRAVRCAARGELFVDAVLATGMLRRRGRPLLSPREREVLQLLSMGRTTQGVGQELFLSPATVQDYAESAMQKLQARNRVHAVALALHRRFISGPALGTG